MRLALPAVFTTSLLLSLNLDAAEDGNDALLELPVLVKTTIQRQATGHPVAAIERDQREGRTVYRVRIAQEGIDKRLVIATDGSLLEVKDYPALNSALSGGKKAGQEAWDKTKEVSGEAWDATKDAATRAWEASKTTVHKATSDFKSEDLTLNQVPRAPRQTMEQAAAGDRLSGIRVSGDEQAPLYHATITRPDGTTRTLVVREDGTLVITP